ncbi:MAG TPA: YggS family pyridoxal phosphate-dependent enzyme [Chitinophagaceae bacterium]|nr:YggS family pyridoxal phosphate-dependent enzyme [Chitinophagaceae bacterium]
MPVLTDSYQGVLNNAIVKGATLIAVSKTKPVADILALYETGHRDFGENYVQELTEKHNQLPQDIRWHFIGHLQSNKVKYIAPFVHMIHGVESIKLLREINKQGEKCGRIINCLLQLYVASEETKFGLDETEVHELLRQMQGSEKMEFVQVCGVMAMASFTDNKEQVRSEFKKVKSIFDILKQQYFDGDERFSTISMGMSGDYVIALEEGSTMIRVGSLIFGER